MRSASQHPAAGGTTPTNTLEGSALSSSALEGENSRRDRALLALQAIGVAITSGQDLPQVLNAVTSEMAHLLDMKACHLSRWDQDATTRTTLASYGPDLWPGGDALPPFPQLQEALMARRPYSLAKGWPDLAPVEEAYLQQAGLQIWVVLPMVFQERILGLIEVMDDEREHDLIPEEISLAQLLADQAATALENARLYDTVHRHVAELTTLNRIGQVITSILDLDKALSIIADQAIWLLDVEAASVILYEEHNGSMWFGAAAGHNADSVRDRRLAHGKGVVDWVIQHGEPLLVPNAPEDPRFFDGWDRENSFATRSILCVPLQAKGQTIGAIEALNKQSGAFDQEDLMLLTSLAASAAIAIENARLYEQARQEIGERRRVEDKLRDIASKLEDVVADRTRELQSERDRTQAILEAVGEAVIVTDLGGQIRYLNPAAVDLTGYTVEAAADHSPYHWQDDLEPSSTPAGAESAAALETRSAEVVSRRRDGSLYDAAMTVAPLFDSQQADRLIGYVSVQRDITPIKEAERIKDQFVSNVSHELRTPLSILTLISGNLDRLYDRLADERRRSMIQGIRDQAQVLNSLIDDVLEISRIESGRVSLERQKEDLALLAQEEVEKQLPLAQRKDQVLDMAGAGPILVWANAVQIRQVIRNLVNNAIKYTPESGRITCECRTLPPDAPEELWPGSLELPAGRWAALRVVDTGIGIAQEDLPHLYERFYRVKTQSNIPGTGLGLSISQELVDLHEGRIAIASTVDQGSIFAVYLPLLEEPHGD